MPFPFAEAWTQRRQHRRRVMNLQRVCALATMPSRSATFEIVVSRLLSQVDHMFVFLDGFDRVPAGLAANSKIVVRRSEEVGDLHAAGRFLVLREIDQPSVVLVVDDDIDYPRDYVARMAGHLAATDGRAIVGVHGGRFVPPCLSHIHDVRRYHFAKPLPRMMAVDELGAGTCAFLSEVLHFDPSTWPTSGSNDLMIAMEAKMLGIPLLCVPRRRRWLRPLEEDQPDSLWVRAKRDPAERDALMRELIATTPGTIRAGLSSHVAMKRQGRDPTAPAG